MLDASSGYYINPSLNVLLEVLFLSERLRTAQKFAVLLAIVGVVLQLISLIHSCHCVFTGVCLVLILIEIRESA